MLISIIIYGVDRFFCNDFLHRPCNIIYFAVPNIVNDGETEGGLGEMPLQIKKEGKNCQKHSIGSVYPWTVKIINGDFLLMGFLLKVENPTTIKASLTGKLLRSTFDIRSNAKIDCTFGRLWNKKYVDNARYYHVNRLIFG